MQDLLKEVHNQFIEAVKKGRGNTPRPLYPNVNLNYLPKVKSRPSETAHKSLA